MESILKDREIVNDAVEEALFHLRRVSIELLNDRHRSRVIPDLKEAEEHVKNAIRLLEGEGA